MPLAFLSYHNSCGIESFNYHFFFLLNVIVPLTVHLTCKGFESDNFDYILTSVGSVLLCCVDTWSANQSLYLFWMTHSATFFTNKFTGWNLLVRLWGNITTSQLFSPHSSLKVSLFCPLKVSITVLLKNAVLTGILCHVRYFPSRENLSLRKIPEISVLDKWFSVSVTEMEGQENFGRLRLVFPE